jgi:hypothetical protein
VLIDVDRRIPVEKFVKGFVNIAIVKENSALLLDEWRTRRSEISERSP